MRQRPATPVDFTNARARKSFESLLRRVRDLVFEVTGRMIPAKLAERRLVQLMQNVTQLLGCGITGGEALAVDLAQRADKRVAVLVADFAIMVAVAIVETCLAHDALSRACGRQHPPAGTKGQPITWAANRFVRRPVSP